MSFLNALPKESAAKATEQGSTHATLPCTVTVQGSKVSITYDFAKVDGTPNTGHIRLTKKAQAPYVTLDTPESAVVDIDGTPVRLDFSGMRSNAYLKIAAAASK